jgi:HD-GYP domain-containing protein (c-di-GMP phosphodiesterase class II)
MTEEQELSFSNSKKILEEVIKAMAEMVEVRDPYTARHQRSVARLCGEIGLQLGLSDWQVKGLQQAATIHDIGKIYIPSEILTKPGKLSDNEFDLVKLHSEIGYRILKGIEFPWPVAQIILQHHERMNGSGYPSGLFSKGILIEAKILSVADVIESMSTDRPYRPALGIEAALREIENNKYTLYDEDVVDSCIFLFTKKKIRLPKLISA